MFHVLNGTDSMLVIVGISGYADQTIVDESDDEGLGGSVLGFGCIVPHSSTGRQSCHSPVGNLNHQGFISLVKAVPK